MARKSGLVLFAHGSPTGEGVAAIRAIAARVAEALPTVPVELGWLGHADPTLGGAVQRLADSGCDRVVVVPLLLTPGAHAERDVPAAVAGVTAAGPGSADVTLVLVAGGGLPVADAEAARVAHLAGALGGFGRGVVAFAGSQTGPDVATVLAQTPGAVVVVPYLLAPGVLLERVRAVTPTTEPLGGHPGVVSSIVDRFTSAPPGTPAGAWVALVGGGPGHPGLLTQRGVELLRAADVVITDRLAFDLPSLASAAEVITVGKGPGGGATQEEINALIVQHGLAGRAVVRLKGGDPYVFARGGDEVAACTAAGLAVEVVPGVTSALAAPSVAGIPVTHKGVSAAFTVISAHRAPGSADDPHDWDALARLHGTLIVLMGVRTLAAVCAELVRRGRAATTPVALIASAWLPEQQVERGTLATIGASTLKNPAVLVVGEVVTLLSTGADIDLAPGAADPQPGAGAAARAR
jgi:uroporphyrin-III C-methyltransferase